MPPEKLPTFPTEVTPINEKLAVVARDGDLVFLNREGHTLWISQVDDLGSFRLFTSQLCFLGNTTQRDIARTFGVSLRSVRRGVKLLREGGGVGAFYGYPRKS